MGIWMNSEKDIIEKIAEALDDIEGDFTQESLFQALKKCKEYPYVCDKIIKDKAWNKYLNEG